MQLTILHTNDLHGRVDALARIATLVAEIRAETPHRVIYVDAGDVEETTTRLSNLTKGVAMHRLLSAAGCEVACVGNAAWLRYGTQVVAEHAAASSYPLLLANLEPVAGTVPSVLMGDVGFVGVTDPFRSFLAGFDFGIRALDEVEVVRTHARRLRAEGAALVVVLSHLGFEPPEQLDVLDDRGLAAALEGDVDVIVGAHTHHLLPHGEWIGGVLVTQAGEYGEHLGRIEIDADRIEATVLAVPADTPVHPAVVRTAGEVEAALDASLDETVAVLDAPLDAQWIAEMLRERMDAEVGLVTSRAALDRPLPSGPLRRGDLWEACHSTANPGLVELSGERLLRMLVRGNDPEFQQTTAGPLRGAARGPLCVAGGDEIDPEKTYRVAATDFEFEPYGGLVEGDWDLSVRYDFPTIVREAIEERLTSQGWSAVDAAS
jgi:2',3'-cyclic-nucleotide 2'-phosphodiesterase (5'-nucleotidase family)